MVFTDLVDSTALAQRLGDNVADEVRRTHFDLLRKAVDSTGGTEVKTIGDALMASYTSASDAIDGAVRMQQNIDAHNRTVEGPRLAMRIGMSAGDATFEDGDWFGTPVVEASRLCGAAEGDQILLTEIVRALAGSRSEHTIESVGEVQAKGLTEPLQACEVRWAPLDVGGGDAGALLVPLPAAVDQTETFEFAGRQAELAIVIDQLKEAFVGERRAVLISGEPGIGKTRLVRETCRRAHSEGAVVLWGSCDDELGIPYQPFAEAFNRLVRTTPSDQLAGLFGPLGGELVRMVPDLEQLVPGLDAPLQSEPESERYRLFEAAKELIVSIAARSPVVLVLDDLHWAGKPTLLLLRHLLRDVADIPLFLVITYRDTDLDRTHPLSDVLADLRRESGVTRLALTGLGEDELFEFMERTAGHTLGDEARELAGALHEETEGNPFFVGEVLRHLAETGA
ncbi:MAG: AAA family ATPase, partial [Acidobacteria bacterium]|nr:AAA family ATPase [Acidobacteriota bacterium]